MFKKYIYGALAVAFVVSVGWAYHEGEANGSASERASWEIEIYNLRSAMASKKHQAEIAGRAIERKYLKSEREKSKLRLGRDRALVDLMRTIPAQIESETHETTAPVCRPYDMLAYPSILRNIKER